MGPIKASLQTLKKPLVKRYMLARSGIYFLESLPLILMTGLTRVLRGESFGPEMDLKEYRQRLISYVNEIHEIEASDIERGVYSVKLLEPEKPSQHLLRYIRLYIDSIGSHFRRLTKKNKVFSKEAEQWLEDLPDYYKRNFHFQTDGYLNESSADLYDHQVEILFRGTADVMRRRILSPMYSYLGQSRGKGKKILEVAAGAGSATRFVAQTFPEADLTATDISYPYLNFARKRLSHLSRINFLQANAESLPFANEQFDIVFSVYLFHEVPREIRAKIIKEKLRVLKPGGLLVIMDSVQEQDDLHLTEALKQFPQDFHEPFYVNYLKHPLEDIVSELRPGVEIKSEQFFLSKRLVIVK